MSRVSAISVIFAGALFVVAAITGANFNNFGVKFVLNKVWQRCAVGVLGAGLIATGWALHERTISTQNCTVSGTATTTGPNSPATISGCAAIPAGNSTP